MAIRTLDTLKTALTVALNQSPFLNVLPENKVASTLKLMTRPVNAKLTPDVARELCLSAGSKAYIAGAIASLGSEYVVGLKAVNCRTDEPLAQEQITASGKEKVLNAVGDAVAKLRGQLGESLATVQKFDVPLQEATTCKPEPHRLPFSRPILVNSPPKVAVEDAKRFLDMEKTYALMFDEKTVVGSI